MGFFYVILYLEGNGTWNGLLWSLIGIRDL